jgi:hypothetical protein
VSAPVRPLDLGRTLDAAFEAYRDAFVPLVVSVAVVAAPVELIGVLPGIGPALTRLALQVLVVSAVTIGMATRVVADLRTGLRPTVGSLWSRVGPLTGWLALTVAMAVVVTALGAIAFVVPAILLWVWFQLAGCVVVIEGRRGTGALGRSRDLSRGFFWRVAGYAIVAGAITVFAALMLSAAVAAAGSEFGVSLAGFRVLTTLVGIAADVLVAPLGALVIAQLYFDIRLRREGTDLIAMLDAL